MLDGPVAQLDGTLQALDGLLYLIEVEMPPKPQLGGQQHAVRAQAHGQQVPDTFGRSVDGEDLVQLGQLRMVEAGTDEQADAL